MARRGSGENAGKKGGSHVAVIVGGILLVIVLYVLSPIPVAWLLERTGLVRSKGVLQLFMTVYMPLEWLDKNWPPVHDFYEFYGRLLGL